jgi:hypothetical protein
MGIEALYRRPRTTKAEPGPKVCLASGVVVAHVAQDETLFRAGLPNRFVLVSHGLAGRQ